MPSDHLTATDIRALHKVIPHAKALADLIESLQAAVPYQPQQGPFATVALPASEKQILADFAKATGRTQAACLSLAIRALAGANDR